MSNGKGNEERRRAAQEAMAGADRHKRILERDLKFAERRKHASVAMEGPEQRARRIAREKALHATELAQKEHEIAKQKAIEMEKLRKAEAERLRQTEEESKRKQEEAKLEEIRHSEETIAAIKQKPTTMSAIRTFKGDMERVIQRGASQASIVIAEGKRREQMGAAIPEPTHSKARIAMIAGIIVFVVAGVGVLGYTFISSYFQTPAQITRVAEVSSILPAEETRALNITSTRSGAIINTLASMVRESKASSTGIVHIYFTASQGSSTPKRIGSSEWQRAAVPTMPLLLTRALSGEFMYGILSNENPSGFIILSITSAEDALSGMLAWEGSIANNLLPTITGESGESASGFSFEDRVLRNLDTRLLRDEAGNQALLYSVVPGKKLVIITRDQSTFDELITRLSTPRSTGKSSP